MRLSGRGLMPVSQGSDKFRCPNICVIAGFEVILQSGIRVLSFLSGMAGK